MTSIAFNVPITYGGAYLRTVLLWVVYKDQRLVSTRIFGNRYFVDEPLLVSLPLR